MNEVNQFGILILLGLVSPFIMFIAFDIYYKVKRNLVISVSWNK